MIELKNVTKKYGNFIAVDNISFEIGEGQIVGLLGPNGAGKSTTMNMITGFIEQTEGEILINNVDVLKKPKKAKKYIGYMPESTPLYLDLTPREFLNYMAELKMIPRKERKQNVEDIIKKTGLEDVQNKIIKNLSRGYKQRVSLAGSLVGNPKVLILDEPTVGLDPKQITEIRTMIKSLGKEHTVILSSHILSEVSQICEKVIIINKGKIVAIDSPENLENKVEEANSILVTVEDKENKIDSMKETIENIKEIKLIKDLEDGTKQYMITCDNDKDVRKDIFEEFAKAGITIFELKKTEATLEDAFMKLISQTETVNEEVKENSKNKKKKIEDKKEEGK